MEELLNYTVSGEGEPVVFIHGFMEDISSWDKIIPQLQGKKCIAVDLHGHGKSFFDGGWVPSITKMAQQVRAVITSLDIETYQAVGHSLGGYIALDLLKWDPDLEQAVLLNSHPYSDSDEKKADRDRVIEMVKTRASHFIREALPNQFAHPDRDKEALDRYIAIAEKMQPEAIAWSAAAMRDRLSSESLLTDKPGKIAIIAGEKDKLVDQDKLRRLAEETEAPHFSIEDCGHMCQEENPEKVVEMLKILLG
jgi:2-succinyl-6-hydroxy-2,4-cyclohexadiene-1-carboxylate synthase